MVVLVERVRQVLEKLRFPSIQLLPSSENLADPRTLQCNFRINSHPWKWWADIRIVFHAHESLISARQALSAQSARVAGKRMSYNVAQLAYNKKHDTSMVLESQLTRVQNAKKKLKEEAPKDIAESVKKHLLPILKGI